MKLDNLSKHGILTGIIIIPFLIVIIILASNKIHETNNSIKLFKDFNGYDQNSPPSLDGPVTVIVISLILIIVTALMILGIIKERLVFIAPWLIVFGIGVIAEVVLFVHLLISYFSAELVLYILCILAIQILIFSPIAWIFHGIRCKNREHYFGSNLQQDIEINLNKDSIEKIKN
ncbi:uncharacterized protein ACRADG_001547 [Cochliomyia hominivorax]